MPDSETEKRKERHRKLAVSRPALTILSDHPLSPDETYRDSFNLDYHLGPVFDIIRHSDTVTPMTIAIYGDWGTGKTTAMKWLHSLIDAWNKEGKAKDNIHLKPVWFYPWKYDNKEDVWRGLIAEVIIGSIDVKEATIATVTKAAKQFGLFLGKSFLHVLAGLKLRAGVPGAGEAELSLSGIKDILEEYREAAHPEKAFLNEFETTLESWIKETLGKNERTIIFIDDLDRCMPEIAFQVLEALKLYLNIKNLIFVIGLDREVIDRLVEKHYEGLGFDTQEHKRISSSYLAKMFQVEVRLGPSEQQIGKYLDEWLQDREYWKDELSDDERHLFRRLIFKFSKRNAREVKRLINSVLIAGAGVEMIRSAENDDIISSFEFRQGLQVFFIRKILDDPYKMPRVVGSNQGDEFFQKWSQIVRKNKGDESFPRTVKVPDDFGKEPPERIVGKEVSLQVQGKQVIKRILQGQWDLSFAHPAYHELLRNQRFSHLFHLLSDEDLGELMLIEYSPEIATIVKETDLRTDADIIREAVARELKKNPQEITQKDYPNVEALNLSDTNIADLNLTKGMNALTSLFVERTPITNLEPTKELKNLEKLGLADTDVADLAPLGRLTGLSELFLSGTKVSSLEPLRNLSNLSKLDLRNTKVVNIEPLEGLPELGALDLRNTLVSNLAALKGLTKLNRLYLSDTLVSNLEPLKDMRNLKELYLSHTQVSDLDPLRALTGLEWLDLSFTPISNLDALKDMRSLRWLSLVSAGRVTDFVPIGNLTNLRALDLTATRFENLSLIEELPNLERLYLAATEVKDLSPIKSLINLTTLDLTSARNIADLDPVKELQSLSELTVRGTNITDKQIASLQKALPTLRIHR